MNFLLLDVSSETNTKTQETFNMLKVFGEVSKFGKISKEAITVRIDMADIAKYKPLIGKQIDLNIVLPHSDYSYSLAK